MKYYINGFCRACNPRSPWSPLGSQGTQRTIGASVTVKYPHKSMGIGRIPLLLFLLMIAFAQTAMAQNLKTGEYFFNTDPGTGKGTPISFSSTSAINTSFSIPAGSLPEGFQQLFIRFKDSLNRWGVAEQRAFYIDASTGAATVLAPIITGEYFFDTDPGTGKGKAITVAKSDSLATTAGIAVTGLTKGFHQVFLRYKDSLNRWGVAEQRSFYVDSSLAAGTGAPIITGEYFFDTDPGTGKGKAITVAKSDSLAITAGIAVTGLTKGFHQVFLRYKDSLNRWGVAEQRSFYVDSSLAAGTGAPIITGEYFFDTDPGTGKGKAITVAKSDSLATTAGIAVTGLTKGFHQVFLRYKDSLNRWGIAEQRSFYVDSGLSATLAPIVAAEYFINKDTGTGKGTPLPIIKTDSLNQSVQLGVPSGLKLGNNYIYVRFKDSTGRWGIAEPRTINIVCKPNLGNDTTVKICAGSYTNITGLYAYKGYAASQWNTPRPDSVGIGAYTLIVTSSLGCKDTAVVTVVPYPKPSLGKDTAVYTCLGTAVNIKNLYATVGYATVTWNTQRPDSITLAGNYTLMVANSYGCSDTAIVTVDNYPKPNLGKDTTLYTCLGTAVNIKTLYNTTGYATVTWSTARPDSITTAGAYTLTVTNSNGCKDTAVVTVSSYPKPNLGKDTTVYTCLGTALNIKNVYNTTGYATVTWNTARPDSITVAGAYTIIVINSNGCKDTAVVTVSNYPKPNLGKDTTVTISSGATANISNLYNLTGLTAQYSTPTPNSVGAGTYTLIVTNSNGCKDTAIITVKVITTAPVIYSFNPVTAGAGATITIKGRYFTGATVVSFGGTPAASFKVVSDTVITAVTGNGASGLILVTAPGGTATLAGFVFCTPVAPTITIASSIGSPICTGTKVTFTATATNGGTTPAYQWYKDNTKVGINAATYTDSLLKNSDSVWCVLTGNATCVTTNTAKSNVLHYIVNPTIVPSVTISTSPTTTICTAVPVTFTAAAVNSGAAPVYQWKKNGVNVGTNSPVYIDSVPVNGDSVAVTLTSNAACTVLKSVSSNSIKLTVTALAKPVVTKTGNTAFCLGDSMVLTTNATGSLQWYRDNGAIKLATGNRYAVRLGGSYKLKATNSGGCSIFSDSVVVVVTQVPTPIITLVNDTLVSSSATGNQWFEDGVLIPGATLNKYSPVNIDVYTVQVTSGGCTSQMSAQFIYAAGTLGIHGKMPALGNVKVLLYPNPASDAANLQLSGFAGGVIVTITDMAGKVVWQQDKLTNSTYTLPLSNLAQGMYIITVKDRNNISTLKLVKAK